MYAKPQQLTRLRRRRDAAAEQFDHLYRLGDQRRIAGRELPALEIEIVLKPDADMSAEDHGLGRHWELVQRNPESEPGGAWRQQIAHVEHGLWRCGLTPRDAEANLEHAGRLDEAALDHAFGEQQVTSLEHFQFGRDAGFADVFCHRFEDGRRVHEYVWPHVHAAHVERTDFRAQIEDVLYALTRRAQRGAGAGLHRVVRAWREAAARAGRQIDNDIRAAGADPVNRFGVVRALHAGQTGLRIAHMDVHDRRAGLGGIDRGRGNLFRGHRHRRVFADAVSRPGDGARNHHLA